MNFAIFRCLAPILTILSPNSYVLSPNSCLLSGLKCNAVNVGRFVRVGEIEGFYEVQPRWVEKLGEPTQP